MNGRRSYYAVSHLDGRHLCAPAAESILNNDGAAWLPFTGFSTGGTTVPFTYTPNHRAVLAIFNERGSDAVVRIDEIRLLPLMGKGSTQGTAIAPPTFRLARLTDLSGGEPITFRKLDTSNPDLPPQVLACINPGSFTLGNTVFWKPDGPLWTRAMAFPVSMASRNSAASAWNGAAAIIAGYAESRCQRVILGEGEGISVATLGGASDYSVNRPVAITITLRTQGGNCYMASRTLSSGAGAGNELGAYPFFALFNSAGSGLVIEVVGLTVQEIRDALEMPVYTLEFIEGLEGGYDLTPAPADSAYPALPAGIIVQEDALIRPLGISRGAAIVNNIRRLQPPVVGAGPQFAGYGILPLSMRAPSMAAVYGNSSALVEPFRIREGEGAALVLKNGSAWGLFEAGITFSLESARELSRSETIYVS